MIAAELPATEKGHIVNGMYDSASDKVYILSSLLAPGKDADLFGCMSHEFEHRKSGASDRTREFENALTNKIGKLLERIYNFE